MSNQFYEATNFFVATFSELALLFIVISLIVSLVNEYLPNEKVKGILSGNKGYGAAISIGALTPFCSCSTIPMLVGLLKAKAQFGPVMAFLFTSPLLNPFIVSLFWVTFGVKITVLYAFFAILMAGVSGWLLHYFRFEQYVRVEMLIESESGKTNACASTKACSDTESAVSSSCSNAAPEKEPHIAFRLIKETLNQLRIMLPYMALGVAVGAILHGFVPTELFTSFSDFGLLAMVPLSALIGVFLYVRASTMIPIAASLIAKGMSIGSVMSLTIAGAGASLPEMIILKRLFRWQLLAAFTFSVFFTACITGFAIELLV
ncbi:permease [Colwelliaceae bacterium 6471]